MSLIHLYLDKNNNSNDDLIKLLRKHHIDFLQHNIENNDTYLKSYDLKNIPAAKFEKSIIYDINENSVKALVEEFINFTDAIPNSINIQTKEKENKKDENQILMDTLKVSDKEKLSYQVKSFSDKHKK